MFNQRLVRTLPPYFFTYGAMVSNDRWYFEATTRVGRQARNSRATALAWVYPESANGRSTSSLVHDSAGIGLACRKTMKGMVANCLLSYAVARISSGFRSEERRVGEESSHCRPRGYARQQAYYNRDKYPYSY